MQMNVAKNNLDTGSGCFSVVGGTSARNEPENACKAVDSAPSDLLGFVRGQSIGSAAAALQLPRATVYRLIQGYWPADSRKIMQAWVDYKGRTGRIDSGWFLRRVREGVIKHAGFDWSCEGLMQRSGELVACSKTACGLIAQTLELPATRMQLAKLEA